MPTHPASRTAVEAAGFRPGVLSEPRARVSPVQEDQAEVTDQPDDGALFEAAAPPVAPPLALYRRYRPDTFAEVIGQEHVTEPLQRALVNNRVNHAYLFSGPRGCGKTTSARILARALNCEQGPAAEPCGECESCRDLATGGPGSIDVIEIDAASHGGVDDARDLRERAFFAPVNSRYKIYIVDEAHMVTTAGFNALLKLVEEPPPHVKFIFATTEPDKVIGTIRSRTHHYPFRLVPPRVLSDYLAKLCVAEGIEVENGVLPLVVRAGAGSVRDSLSVLDQLLGGADEQGVSYSQAAALLGYTPDSLLDEMLDAFAAGDSGGVFRCVDKVIEVGQDPRRFAEDLLRRVRDLVIVAAVPDALTSGLVDVADDQAERFSTQAAALGTGELTRAGEVLAAGLTEMRGTTAPRLHLELMCARVLLPGTDLDDRGVHARLDRIERRIGMTGSGAVPAANPSGPATSAPQPSRPESRPQSAAPSGPRPVEGPGTGSQATAGTAPKSPEPVEGPGAESQGTGATAPKSPEPAEGPGAGTHGTAAKGPKGPELVEGPGTRPAQTAPPGAPQHPPVGDDWPEPATPGAPAAPAAETARSHSRPAPDSVPAAPRAEPQQPSQGSGLTVTDLRRLWPEVLEDVKNRRRFTWILLSQNAHVADLTNRTLVLAMPNAGARDSFARGGSEDVLKESLIAVLGADLQIETMVDPSAGPGAAGRGGGRPPSPPPGDRSPEGSGGSAGAGGGSTEMPPASSPPPPWAVGSPGEASTPSSADRAGGSSAPGSPADGSDAANRARSGSTPGAPAQQADSQAGADATRSSIDAAGANNRTDPARATQPADRAASAGSTVAPTRPGPGSADPPPWAVDGPAAGPDEWEVRDAAAHRDDDVLNEAVESHTELLQRRLGAEIIAEEETGA
ncbi:DNA polymerase III subunit gamma and tau [Microlunatus elymi]